MKKADVYPNCNGSKVLGEALYSKNSLFYASRTDYTSGFVDKDFIRIIHTVKKF